MNGAHLRGSWLVYFNGVEVPATQVSVTHGVWALPRATISIPADRIMQRIGINDRVRVTIFALDPYRHQVEGGEPQFRLMFDGEIVNYGYSSSANGRSITYAAVDMIEALARLLPFLTTSLTSLAKGALSTDDNKVTATPNPFAITHSLLNSGISGGQRIKRPFDFVHNILRYLLGGTLQENEKSVIVKQWFVPWNERTGFSSRFVPSAYIESLEGPEDSAVFPILRAAQRASAVEALAKMGDRLGANGTFYQLIQTVFQSVYYELAMLASPPVLTVNKTTREIVGGPSVSLTDNTERVLAAYMTKPQMLFGIPPKCNVLWPSMIQQFSYDENYALQPTRTYLGDPHLFNYMESSNTAAGLQAVAMRAVTVAFPTIANARLRDKEANPAGGQNHHNYITEEEYFKGPVYNLQATPTWFMYLHETPDKPDDTGATNQSRALQQLYARYEHYLSRAAKRNGGVVCSYNPYVTPGFPGMVIDAEHSSNHVMGYFTNVTHSFSQDSMTTNIGFTHAQTVSEYMDNLVDQMVTDGIPVRDAQSMSRGAPEHPLRELRSIFQTLDGANKYYSQMFFGDTTTPRSAAFDIFDVFGLADATGAVRPLDPVSEFVQAFAPSNDPEDPRAQLRIVSNLATGEPPDFRITSKYRPLMTDHMQAMAYASRPICTLEQYIDLQGDYGVRGGLRAPNNPLEGKGAPYYVQITVGNPGPDYPPPTVDRDGNPCDPPEVDSTRDWRARFMAYRTRVYTLKSGIRA